MPDAATGLRCGAWFNGADHDKYITERMESILLSSLLDVRLGISKWWFSGGALQQPPYSAEVEHVDCPSCPGRIRAQRRPLVGRKVAECLRLGGLNKVALIALVDFGWLLHQSWSVIVIPCYAVINPLCCWQRAPLSPRSPLCQVTVCTVSAITKGPSAAIRRAAPV